MHTAASTTHGAPQPTGARASSPKPVYVCLDTPQVLLQSVGAGALSNPFSTINAETVRERAHRPNSLSFRSPVPNGIRQVRQSLAALAPPRKHARADVGETAVANADDDDMLGTNSGPGVEVRELDEVELLAPFSPTVTGRWRAHLDVSARTVKTLASRVNDGDADASSETSEPTRGTLPLHAPWLTVPSAVHMAALAGHRDVQQVGMPPYAGGAREAASQLAPHASATETAREDGLTAACAQPQPRDVSPTAHLHLHPSVLQRYLLQALLILQQPGRSRSARFFVVSGACRLSGDVDSSFAVADRVFAMSVLPSGVEELATCDDRARRVADRGGFAYGFGEALVRTPSEDSTNSRSRGCAVVAPASSWQCHSLNGVSDGGSPDPFCASWGVVEFAPEAHTGASASATAATTLFRSAEAWTSFFSAPLAPASSFTHPTLDGFLVEEVVPRLYTYVPPPVTPEPGVDRALTTRAVVYYRALRGFVQRQCFACLSLLAHFSWGRWVMEAVCGATGTSSEAGLTRRCHYRLCLVAAADSSSSPFGLAQGAEWTSFVVLTHAAGKKSTGGDETVDLVVRIDDCHRQVTWRRGADAPVETGTLGDLTSTVITGSVSH